MDERTRLKNDHLGTPTSKSKRHKKFHLMSEATLCPKIFEDSYQKTISKCFRSNTDAVLDGTMILKEPFFCCAISDFVSPVEYVLKLKREVERMEMKEMLVDIFKFHQSDDLRDCEKPCISAFVKLLKEDLLNWMRSVTNIALTDKVAASCSSYSYTDYLLCHDDHLEGRRIAFIYYLTPEWTQKDGGALTLFETVNGQPGEISKEILPSFNKFVFFEVSPVSFHEVAEVLTDKTRLAISGWFHGPSPEPPVPLVETILLKPPGTFSVDITEWISPMYLDPAIQLEIRNNFEEESEVELNEFFLVKKYNEVCKVLADENTKWERKGPPNRRRYQEISNIEAEPLILQECQALFCSEAFFLVLSNLTGLKLHPACEEDCDIQMGKSCSSIRRWQNKCYSLLHDESFTQQDFLHATMYFNCSDWDPECGGCISYVAEGENDELLLVEPKPNSLALVYITEGTSSFVKYINCRANMQTCKAFNDIFTIYAEEK